MPEKTDLASITAPTLEKIAQLVPPRKHASLAKDLRALANDIREGKDGAKVSRVAETLRTAASIRNAKVVEACLDCAHNLVALGLIAGPVKAQWGKRSEGSTDQEQQEEFPPVEGVLRGADDSATAQEGGEHSASEAVEQPDPEDGEDSIREQEQQQHKGASMPGGASEAEGGDASEQGANRRASANEGEIEEEIESAHSFKGEGRDGQDEKEQDRGESDQERSKSAMAVIDLSCEAAELGDEHLELPVLRCLLSLVTSTEVHVHDGALLRVVRAAYNIHLSSRSEVNQTAAKASLTQMLMAVFHRMEKSSPYAAVPTVVVSELLHSTQGNEGSSSSPTAPYVQQFLNKIAQDLGSAFGPVSSASASETHHAQSKDASQATQEVQAFKRVDYSSRWQSPMKAGPREHLQDEEVQQWEEQLRHDAFLVFRALCKLSLKDPSDGGGWDTSAVRGKLLALQLLKMLLENAGHKFCNSSTFISAMKQYLSVSLVKNAQSSNTAAFHLSCSIFLTLVQRFRQSLKAEVGIFYPIICLTPLEPGQSHSQSQRIAVLSAIQKLCEDGQWLVDLFVNFDCDMGGSNLFERTVGTLVQVARGGETSASEDGFPARHLALSALVDAFRSLARWVESNLELTGRGSSREQENLVEAEIQKANKQEWQHGVDIFNKKPKKGLKYLQDIGKLGKEPDDIASFLQRTPGLDKVAIGDFLGEKDEPNISAMHAYVDTMDFSGLEIDEAIRKFLSGFRLPGEAQKIDRLMEKFAERYCDQHPDAFRSADTAYILAYSVIMLNTDAHNPQVKNKMTLTDFVRNNRRIDNGENLPDGFLSGIYHRITSNEIKMKEDDPEAATKVNPGSRSGGQSNRVGMDVFVNLLPGKKQRPSGPDTEAVLEAVRSRQRNGSGEFCSTLDPAAVRPILDVAWAPSLAVFSQLFDEFPATHLPSSNPGRGEGVPLKCLEGFRLAVKITGRLQQETLRDAFVTSLANLTLLQSPASMTLKNGYAMRELIRVAKEDGDTLQSSWAHILACISRHEHLYQLAEGYDDASHFDEPKRASESTDRGKRSHLPGSPLPRSGSSRKRSLQENRGTSAQPQGQHSWAEVEAHQVPSLEILRLVPPESLDELFVGSHNLSSDAVLDFAKALCEVAMGELRGRPPRVYSLGKIVEFAHHNMFRIRLVWRRIWSHLSEFFVEVGKHDNLNVAMYAVDSLRQLSMKFLERDELSKYTFQNDFLAPFATLMREPGSHEVKELILRCVSQMMAARVRNIKSGWRAVFEVLRAAAEEGERSLVILAFETIERVIREYFSNITEADRTTFTDCVRCLVSFTKTRCSSDVSLNAIAFLRFCALKLAEGLLGNLEEAAAEQLPPPGKGEDSEGEQIEVHQGEGQKKQRRRKRKPTTTTFTDKEAHVYFWFPLLEGLSELVFDPRPSIRRSALEVLYDILLYHGNDFAESFWIKVFDDILFPILNSVSDSESSHQPVPDHGWLRDTFNYSLDLVVHLSVEFHSKVSGIWDRLLRVFAVLIEHPDRRVSGASIRSMQRLFSGLGNNLSNDEWQAASEVFTSASSSMISSLVSSLHSMPHSESLDGVISLARNSAGRVDSLVELLSMMEALHAEFGHGLATGISESLIASAHNAFFQARAISDDWPFRASIRHLVALAAADQGQHPTAYLLDSPTVSVETMAGKVLMLMLSRQEGLTEGEGKGKWAKQLVEVVTGVLQTFMEMHACGGRAKEEALARTPLVSASLESVKRLSTKAFQACLSHLFPLMTCLMRCDGLPRQTFLMLSAVFREQVGPIVDSACESSQERGEL